MRLFTFQDRVVSASVQSNGRFVNGVASIANEWMAGTLRARGIALNSDAPVWAWHSKAGVIDERLVHEVGRALLSDFQIDKGIEMLELMVPESQVLLSRYDVWNLILEDYLKEELEVPTNQTRQLFDVAFDDERERVLQACLPCIEREWLLNVYPFTLGG